MTCDMLTGDMLNDDMLTGDMLTDYVLECQCADYWQCYVKVV